MCTRECGAVYLKFSKIADFFFGVTSPAHLAGYLTQVIIDFSLCAQIEFSGVQ